MKSLKETLREALQETLPEALQVTPQENPQEPATVTESKLPESIDWIADKNPGEAFLASLGFDDDMEDIADEYREYEAFTDLDKACKKFKFQPNNLKSAEDLIIVLDRFAGFAEAADLDMNEGGSSFFAAQVLNLLHKEYEKVFDENTKVITKLENMPVDEYSKIKNAPLRVVVAALEKYCSLMDNEFDEYSEYVETAPDIVQDYLTNG